MSPPEPPASYPDALAAYHRWCHAHAAEILTTPLLEQLARASLAALHHATTEIARLRAELDTYQGRRVLHVTERNAAAAAANCVSEPPGTLLRATDTGREWVLTHDHQWLPRV